MNAILLLAGYGVLAVSAFFGYAAASPAGSSPTTPRWAIMYTNIGILLAFVVPLVSVVFFTLAMGKPAWSSLIWILVPVAAGLLWFVGLFGLGAILGK